MSDVSKKILLHRSASEYADVVYECITTKARRIMGGGNFTVDELKRIGRVTSKSYPRQAGIYIIIYEEFGGRQPENQSQTYHTAIYIGQTQNFLKRRHAHERQAELGNKSHHYRLAADADVMMMIPLLVQTADNVPPSFLDIAEFSMVCLFRSWYSALFIPNVPNMVAAYNLDFDACGLFSRIMSQISSTTGWNTGKTYGLNWNTPILRHPAADQCWTSWYEDKEQHYVYRTRKNIWLKPTEAYIIWHAPEHIQIPLPVARAAGFTNGQSCHLLVEVAKDKEGNYLPHPFRFVRFPPRIGRNAELEKLGSVAIKIQWLPQGDSEWKQYYLERSKIWQPVQGHAGVPGIFRMGLLALCDVENTTYTQGPVWLPPVLPTRVQFLRYDHLGQQMTVENVGTKTIAWPRDHTLEENAQRLTAMFPPASNPNTVIGPKPGRDFFTNNRSACDLCLSQRTTTKCTYDARDHSCSNCRALCRPCTWSRFGDHVMDLFVAGKRLEELGVSVNLTREGGPHIRTLDKDPYDPDLEAAGQADLVDDDANDEVPEDEDTDNDDSADEDSDDGGSDKVHDARVARARKLKAPAANNRMNPKDDGPEDAESKIPATKARITKARANSASEYEDSSGESNDGY